MVKDLHRLFNYQKRYSFPFRNYKNEIPKNGIYILFEKGEKYSGFDRIVRVGTHTGNNQLRSRLNQHFVNENKNRSIFRKNIGRCFLNKEKHPYLQLWELDITSKEDRERNLKLLDLHFERELEIKISSFIQNRFTFCVFQVDSKEERLYWESKIISSLTKDKNFKSSPTWFGNFSPKDKIRASGLWQVNELYKNCLSNSEFIELNKIVGNL